MRQAMSTAESPYVVRLLGRVAPPDVDWASGHRVAAESNHGVLAPLVTGSAGVRASTRDSRETVAVPFPDEKFAQGVEVVPYRPQWATEGRAIEAVLARMLPEARVVDHISPASGRRRYVRGAAVR